MPGNIGPHNSQPAWPNHQKIVEISGYCGDRGIADSEVETHHVRFRVRQDRVLNSRSRSHLFAQRNEHSFIRENASRCRVTETANQHEQPIWLSACVPVEQPCACNAIVCKCQKESKQSQRQNALVLHARRLISHQTSQQENRRQEENSSEASCRKQVRAALNHDARKCNRGEYHIGPYQPADGRTPAFAVKILEEQQGWNDGRKFDQFIDERPKPLRFTEGEPEWGCVREQSQAIWAGE